MIHADGLRLVRCGNAFFDCGVFGFLVFIFRGIGFLIVCGWTEAGFGRWICCGFE